MNLRYVLPALLLCVSAVAAADDLDPKKAAQIELDRDRALTEVKKKYGDKKLSEMSNDEKRGLAKDTAAAEQKALDKNGANAKDFSRYEAKMSKADREAKEKAREEILAKEKADAEAEKKAQEAKSADAQKEIPIQKGFSDQKPTVMEEGKDAPPIVERGEGSGEQQGAGNQPAEQQGAGSGAKSTTSSKKKSR